MANSNAMRLLKLVSEYIDAVNAASIAETFGSAPAVDPEVIAQQFGDALSDYVRQVTAGRA